MCAFEGIRFVGRDALKSNSRFCPVSQMNVGNNRRSQGRAGEPLKRQMFVILEQCKGGVRFQSFRGVVGPTMGTPDSMRTGRGIAGMPEWGDPKWRVPFQSKPMGTPSCSSLSREKAGRPAMRRSVTPGGTSRRLRWIRRQLAGC